MPQNEAPGGFLNPKRGFGRGGRLCPKRGSRGDAEPRNGAGGDGEPKIAVGGLQISPKIGKGRGAVPAQPNLKSGKPQIPPNLGSGSPHAGRGGPRIPPPSGTQSPKSTHGAGEGPRITPKMGLGEALRNPKSPLNRAGGAKPPLKWGWGRQIP